MSLQQGPNYTGLIILLIERPAFICCSCRPTAHETERGTLALTGRHTGPHLFIGAERVQIINEKQTRTHWDHRSKSQEKECDCRWTRQRRQTFCVKKHVIQMFHPWAQSGLRWNLWSRGGVHMEIQVGTWVCFDLFGFLNKLKRLTWAKWEGSRKVQSWPLWPARSEYGKSLIPYLLLPFHGSCFQGIILQTCASHLLSDKHDARALQVLTLQLRPPSWPILHGYLV